MRQPTPIETSLLWWRNAVATGDNSITDDIPRAGWFKVREKAWSKTWLPAKIWLHQSIDWQTGELTEPEAFRLEIAGRLFTEENDVCERWMRLRPCSLSEWQWLTARLALHPGIAPQAYGADF